MTRAVALLLGICIGVLVGAVCVVIGFNLGAATAAVPSSPAPVVLAPLPPLPPGTNAGGHASSSEPPDAGRADPPVPGRPVTFGEPSVAPASSDSSGLAPVEGGASARLAVRGIASWYSVGEGLYAAAGPALRVGDWRGREVRVCAVTCVTVPLVDWCACGDRPGGPTVIDLSVDAFARLAPPSRGLVEVTVTW